MVFIKFKIDNNDNNSDEDECLIKYESRYFIYDQRNDYRF